MRYKNEKIARIRSVDYDMIQSKNNRDSAIITRTINFSSLKGQNIEIKLFGIWKQGSSLLKIANEAYGDSSLWGTIGMVNSKPTDQHFSVGDEIYVPVDPQKINLLIGTGAQYG